MFHTPSFSMEKIDFFFKMASYSFYIYIYIYIHIYIYIYISIMTSKSGSIGYSIKKILVEIIHNIIKVLC
jgi:hypothetical protein